MMSKNSKRREERKRNLTLIAGVLVLSLGASLIWMHFAGVFDVFFGHHTTGATSSMVSSTESVTDISSVTSDS